MASIFRRSYKRPVPPGAERYTSKGQRRARRDCDRVFRCAMPAWDTFQHDLRRAGLEPADDQGRTFDFHALRHQFGTMLAQSGVSIREAMLLMRHTDIRLTTKVYVDAGLLDTRGAVRKLPTIGSGVPLKGKRSKAG